jgi:propionyl-CoA synthetase
MNSIRVRDFCEYFLCPAENFAGIRRAADAGLIDDDGYIHVRTRTDDIINVAAHRLSTGEIEEVRAAHPDVAECAVIGVADALRGQVPLGLLVLKAGVVRPADDEREAVAGLPKTARARPCAARCGRSPRARAIRCQRRSTTRRYSRKSMGLWQQPATPSDNRLRSPTAVLPGRRSLHPRPAASRVCG